MIDDIFGGIAIGTIAIIFLSFACVIGSLILGFGVFWLYGRRRRGKAEALMATGQQGKATVLSLEDTGILINNNPRVRIGLEIRIPGNQPYQLTKTMTLPMIRMSQVQVGSVVNVIADPAEPENPDKVGLLLK
jgi:hypothetical protein